VKAVVLKNDEILTVKTALGIATIIQVPTSIQSAIIGDQSGFKVEYLDRAVTIKPLRYGAKTNLYLLTEPRRFNLRLVTLTQDLADYVIYIKEPGVALPPSWRTLNLSKVGKDATLSLSRISRTAGGFFLLEGRLTTKTRFSLKPEQIWIKQGQNSKIIQHLYLSSTTASKDHPILIGISINKEDLKEKTAVTLDLQGQESLSLTVPEGLVWR
jgi:hypothetical protein